MGNIKNINFSDKDVFHQYEVQACNGIRCYENFPCEEYKYFDMLVHIGYDYRHNGLSKSEASYQKSLIMKNYLLDVAERDKTAEIYEAYQTNIRQAGQTVSDILRDIDSKPYDELFLDAMRCISLMLGETLTYDTARKLMRRDA